MNIESKIKQNIPLAPLTTFKIGGPAKFFIKVETKKDLFGAYEWAKKNKERIFILAGGSNVLVNDNGVDGLVIKINNSDMAVKGERIECGAGASLAGAARLTIGNNLSGLEWVVGIPGATIGGAVRGNAEAFNSPMSKIVEIADVFNIAKEQFEVFSNKDCKFSYRKSVFKNSENYIIWNITLKFKKGSKDKIYGLVANSINFRNQHYPKLPSAGSVFKNLPYNYIKENNKELADKLLNMGMARLGNIGVGLLIDIMGLKGKTIGGAKVSLEHANHIVNTGKATAENVIMLISLIKQRARNKFGIQLQEEIQYFGF